MIKDKLILAGSGNRGKNSAIVCLAKEGTRSTSRKTGIRKVRSSGVIPRHCVAVRARRAKEFIVCRVSFFGRGKVSEGRVYDAIFPTIEFLPALANLAEIDVPEERCFGGFRENRLAVGAAKIGTGQRLLAGCSGYHGLGKYLKANAHFQSCPAGADRQGIKELYDLQGDLSE